MEIINKGFTLIEVMLALTLGIIFSLAVIALFAITLKSSQRTSLDTQAKLLAKEALEAVIAIRDSDPSQWNFTDTPVNTQDGEYYQPEIVAGKWVLGDVKTLNPPVVLDPPYERFTRIVEVKQVQRAIGCGKTICPIVKEGGTVDPGTRLVIITISWIDEQGESKTYQLKSFLTKWR